MPGAEGAVQDDEGSPEREACRANDAVELDDRTRFDNGIGKDSAGGEAESAVAAAAEELEAPGRAAHDRGQADGRDRRCQNYSELNGDPWCQMDGPIAQVIKRYGAKSWSESMLGQKKRKMTGPSACVCYVVTRWRSRSRSKTSSRPGLNGKPGSS